LLFFSKSNFKNNISYLVIGGLSVSFSLQILAQTTPTSVSPSAALQATGIASNGMRYADMVNMSADEMKIIPFAVRMEFKKWQKDQFDQLVASKTNE
jgi:hypothetical protein